MDELYRGWRRETFPAVRHSQKTKIGERKRVATEVIYCNWQNKVWMAGLGLRILTSRLRFLRKRIALFANVANDL